MSARPETSKATKLTFRPDLQARLPVGNEGAKPGMENDMRIAVVLASLGRPEELAHVVADLGRQTLKPAVIVLSLEKAQDAPAALPEGVEVILGPRGLCAQRNRGLDAVGGRCDVVVFYDDDYVPSRFALEGVARTFAENPDVVGATGLVLADGVVSGGIAYERAASIVAAHDARPAAPDAPLIDRSAAYGCNMAFRADTVADLRFDERLPLYGWQEDVDFAGRVLKRGRMVETDAFAGVHCGVTRGRMPGRRLGFSQVVNPVYLMRKGSMGRAHALSLMAKNIAMNHLKAAAPESFIDRRGRMIGNWLGLAHLLTGRADPMKVLQL
jgi:GT2 family glycosyltransferase